MLEELVPRVYRFALRLTGDADSAEELAQEAFLRAWRARSQLRDEHAARVWLLRIAANLWRDQLRRRGRAAFVTDCIEEVADASPEAPQAAAQKEEVTLAMAALARLPPRQRSVLHLRACEELSIAEIAKVLEISRPAVKASLSAARKRMRDMLADPREKPAECRGGNER